MLNLPELPPKFQNDFENAKANAELEYATRAEGFPLHPHLANLPIHFLKLIEDVFFAFCQCGREACRQGRWTVTKTRQATDAALPLIHEFYTTRDVEGSTEGGRARHLVLCSKMIMDDPQWKRHLAELATLAKRNPNPRPKRKRGALATGKPAKPTEPPTSDAQYLERRQMVETYIDEVLSKTAIRLSRADIWRKAGDKSRTEFERWEGFWYEKRGKKTNVSADQRYRRILLTEKPNLK